MQDLGNYFDNPLMRERLSFEAKQRFSEEHIGKLTTMNTNGQYLTMLAATTVAHRDYFGDFTDVKINEGLQQAQTQTVENIVASFKTRVSRLNRFLISEGVETSPIYQEFFPYGVMEFSQRTYKSNAESHINRLVAAITAHTAEAGGAAVLAEFVAFQTDYAAARSLQLIKKGQTTSKRSSRDDKGVVWADQLFSNLLTLAHEFRDQRERLNDFFDQSILRPQHKASRDGKGILTGLITDSHTQQPLQGAIIHVVDAQINKTRSQLNGAYRCPSMKVGTYTVRVSKMGYDTTESKVEVMDAGKTHLDVQLVPSISIDEGA